MELLIVFICVVSCAISTAYAENAVISVCDGRHVKKIGCYQSGSTLSTILTNERGSINWAKYKEFSKNLACKCANLALAKNMKYFGLQFYGECWGGKGIPTSNKAKAKQCFPSDHWTTSCDNSDSLACMGKASTNYVYQIVEPPVDGGWTSFSEWGGCSMTCGKDGRRTRSRTCTNPEPKNGGKDCEGAASETVACNTTPCPVNGGWSDWGEWAACSATCRLPGAKKPTRQSSRTCTNPAPAHRGIGCVGKAARTQTCNAAVECPPTPCSAEDIVNAVLSAVPGSKKNNRLLEATTQVVKAIEDKIPAGVIVGKSELNNLIKTAVEHSGVEFGRKILGFLLQKEKYCHEVVSDIIKDIYDNLGDRNFKDFLAVDGNVSLIFVVDTTGSMKAEISAAKATIKAIANYEGSGAVEYVLSAFNDPSSGPVAKYTDPNLFKSGVDGLRARGGGDCPELAYNGIIDAIRKEKPKVGSPMYVFTDARPKALGEYNRDNAIGSALDYMIPINFFFTTSRCPDAGSDPDYKMIMQDTGGLALYFNRASDISKSSGIIKSDLDGSTMVASGGSGGSGRKRRSLLDIIEKRTSEDLEFHVDGTITKLMVTVYISSGSIGYVKLYDPAGNSKVVSLNLKGGSMWFFENDAVITGKWRIHRGSARGLKYEVKGSSKVNMMFDVVFTKTDDGSVHTIAQPLKGEDANVKLILTQASMVKQDTLKLHAVHSSGKIDITLDKLAGTFTPPESSFKLVLSGQTTEGDAFERVSREVKASSAVLRSQVKEDMLTLKKGSNTHFVLYNNGETEAFRFEVTTSAKSGQVTLDTPSDVTVTKNGKASGAVHFTEVTLDASESLMLYVTAIGRTSGVKSVMTANLMVVE